MIPIYHKRLFVLLYICITSTFACWLIEYMCMFACSTDVTCVYVHCWSLFCSSVMVILVAMDTLLPILPIWTIWQMKVFDLQTFIAQLHCAVHPGEQFHMYSLCVCVCVCVCGVCACVRACVCACAFVRACMCLCMYLCVYVCGCGCVGVWVWVCGCVGVSIGLDNCMWSLNHVYLHKKISSVVHVQWYAFPQSPCRQYLTRPLHHHTHLPPQSCSVDRTLPDKVRNLSSCIPCTKYWRTAPQRDHHC